MTILINGFQDILNRIEVLFRGDKEDSMILESFLRLLNLLIFKIIIIKCTSKTLLRLPTVSHVLLLCDLRAVVATAKSVATTSVKL